MGEDWQTTEIRSALKEADAGDFASPRSVKAVAREWGVTLRRGAGKVPEPAARRSLFNEITEGMRALADDRNGRRPLRRRTARPPR